MNRVKVELDWRSYFLDFDREHGGSPMVYRGRLYYGDGWSYSQTDYAGPEWPPPADGSELQDVLQFYWRRRHRVVQHEAETLHFDIMNLERMQRERIVPLVQVRRVLEDGVWRSERGPVDLDALRFRLEQLQEDVLLCENRLLKLRLKGAAYGSEEDVHADRLPSGSPPVPSEA